MILMPNWNNNPQNKPMTTTVILRIKRFTRFLCDAFTYATQSLAYFIIATVLSYMLTTRYIKDNNLNPARVIAYILVR